MHFTVIAVDTEAQAAAEAVVAAVTSVVEALEAMELIPATPDITPPTAAPPGAPPQVVIPPVVPPAVLLGAGGGPLAILVTIWGTMSNSIGSAANGNRIPPALAVKPKPLVNGNPTSVDPNDDSNKKGCPTDITEIVSY